MVTGMLINPGGFVSWIFAAVMVITAALLRLRSVTPDLLLLALKVNEFRTQICGVFDCFLVHHPELLMIVLLTNDCWDWH